MTVKISTNLHAVNTWWLAFQCLPSVLFGCAWMFVWGTWGNLGWGPQVVWCGVRVLLVSKIGGSLGLFVVLHFILLQFLDKIVRRYLSPSWWWFLNCWFIQYFSVGSQYGWLHGSYSARACFIVLLHERCLCQSCWRTFIIIFSSGRLYYAICLNWDMYFGNMSHVLLLVRQVFCVHSAPGFHFLLP